jgi:toxin ParE1/3/4
MPCKLTWTKQAREDQLDIYVLIGLEQPAAAERYFDRFEYLAGLLADNPHLGVHRPDIQPRLRMLVERPYLLLYQTEPDEPADAVHTIEIVRIVDGKRNLRTLF